MSIRSRLTRLEKKIGVSSDLLFVIVSVEPKETSNDALERTLSKRCIDRSKVGYVSYFGDEIGIDEERFNGCQGKVSNLKGFDVIRDIMEEIDGSSKGLPFKSV